MNGFEFHRLPYFVTDSLKIAKIKVRTFLFDYRIYLSQTGIYLTILSFELCPLNIYDSSKNYIEFDASTFLGQIQTLLTKEI